MSKTTAARCLSCRSEVSVPDSFAHGAQVGCTNCGTQLRIVRADGLHLVVADVDALRKALRESRQLANEAARELQEAHASWGIGINGLGLGVLYVIAKVALDERDLDRQLMIEAIVLAVLVGILLEVANTLFLAKRSAISRLSEKAQRAITDQREIERQLKETLRRG